MKKRSKKNKYREEITGFGQLIQMVDERLNQLLQSNLQELHLTKQQMITLRRQKQELKQMLRRCGIGDLAAKKYVKQTILQILTEKIMITQDEMEQIFPVHNKKNLSVRDKFEVMISCYEREYGKRALEEWILQHHLDNSRRKEHGIYEISKEQVELIFESGQYTVSFVEWVNLIVQRVYAGYRGLGVVDMIRDMDIDGVSGGVSGRTEEERSVWIMFQGKSIYLSFLCFGSEKELQRICRIIYRYGQPGQLSRAKGYLVNEMADHARVVVARPDFCENWVFFVRKLDNLRSRNLEELFEGVSAKLAVLLLQYIVKGCQTLAITGAQGSGKTTLLMALIAYIEGSHTLRIQETAFELQLRRLYPERNIVSFRETDSISGQEGLDFQKKTDGTVSIVGEVANAKQAALMLQLSQTASLYTLFTHHATSTRSLVCALQNNLIQEGQFSKEVIAQRQVVEAVRFHVHLEKDVVGNRYIAFISEIIPKEQQNKKGDCFEERVLLSYCCGSYRLHNPISRETLEKMSIHVKEEEREEYNGALISCFDEDTGYSGEIACAGTEYA